MVPCASSEICHRRHPFKRAWCSVGDRRGEPSSSAPAEAQAKGYRTFLYFVATNSPEINIARVAQRVAEGGHPVPKDKIVERYSSSIALLDRAVAAANRAYIFDNSGDAHVLLVQSEEGVLTTCVDALPQWFVQSSLWADYAS